MSLNSVYVVAVKRIPVYFEKIREGQAPKQFTQQLLKDLGFTSTNDRALIPLLKSLGFLSSEGAPTLRYHEYRDHSRSKYVMAEAIKEEYEDILLITEYPTSSDKNKINGKFKSYHNVSDHVASLMTGTFLELLALADLKSAPKKEPKKQVPPKKIKDPKKDDPDKDKKGKELNRHQFMADGLHYNIQIHLPATKDIEVYNAIFKSVKEHLLGD